ncbi:hypothetical protein NQ314_008577 [Rhamnusium bicolor]|uniref:Uncharacterized protein n=1 Tax=Rhamnusium bicolor TaxID=1586634 RepID=A0AAV8Y9B0_9CUCU|nr:hypothetical protein NQ314_008577 [Rhamnusium bicolor]
MKVATIVLCSVLYLVLSETLAEHYEYSAEMKTLTPQESSKALAAESNERETSFAEQISRGVPPDNGGNYGDLVHRYREDRDRLLLREVIINQVLSSDEQDIHWSVSISGAKISSVRVLNFGRERGYCLRIDVAGGGCSSHYKNTSVV